MKLLQTELGKKKKKSVDDLLKILASKSHMNGREVAAKVSPNLTAMSANDIFLRFTFIVIIFLYIHSHCRSAAR